MSSAVLPAHHPPNGHYWDESDFSWHSVRFRSAICLEGIEKRVSKCHCHTESYTASIRWNADLTLESSTVKMRAQDLHSAFPANCLLELFANVNCSTNLTMLDFGQDYRIGTAQ